MIVGFFSLLVCGVGTAQLVFSLLLADLRHLLDDRVLIVQVFWCRRKVELMQSFVRTLNGWVDRSLLVEPALERIVNF